MRNKTFYIIRVPFLYVSGHEFRIFVYVKNHGSTIFQGGKIKIFVRYTFGQFQETIEGKIGVIKPNEEVKVVLEDTQWGVLSNGHGLFIAEIVDNYLDSIPLCENKEGKALQRQALGYHVHTIHALSIAEFYTLNALLVSILVFLTNTILTTIVNWGKLLDFWTAAFAANIGPIFLVVFVSVVLWFAFVYFFYDYYGL